MPATLLVDHVTRSRRRLRFVPPPVNSPAKGKKCRKVTFHSRGGKAVTVWRCEGRKLRAHNRNQCRAGSGKSFKARQFVPRLANGKCPVRRAAR